MPGLFCILIFWNTVAVSIEWVSVLCFHSLLFPIQLWLESISACISISWSNLIMSVRSVSHSSLWIPPFYRDRRGSQLYKLHLELLMSFIAQRKELPPPLQKPDPKMPPQWSPPVCIHTLEYSLPTLYQGWSVYIWQKWWYIISNVRIYCPYQNQKYQKYSLGIP